MTITTIKTHRRAPERIRGFEDLQASKPRRKPREIEDGEQMALMAWLELQHPAVFARTIHVPNGGNRSKRVAGRLKAMGTKPGVPDVLCFVPAGGKAGLAVEMKRPGAPPSATSKEQLDWLRWLECLGWHCCICRGFEEARTAFEAYLA